MYPAISSGSIAPVQDVYNPFPYTLRKFFLFIITHHYRETIELHRKQSLLIFNQLTCFCLTYFSKSVVLPQYED